MFRYIGIIITAIWPLLLPISITGAWYLKLAILSFWLPILLAIVITRILIKHTNKPNNQPINEPTITRIQLYTSTGQPTENPTEAISSKTYHYTAYPPFWEGD